MSTIRDLLEGPGGQINQWENWAVVQFVDTFNLTHWGVHKGARVALLLPNGPAAAVCLLAMMSHYCVVPCNPSLKPSELALLVERCSVECLILNEEEHPFTIVSPNLRLIPISLDTSGFPTWHKTGNFCKPLPLTIADDTVLVLLTSGTTGDSKRVPFSWQRLLVSGTLLAQSMNLCCNDVGINMMALYHVGGITCNIIGPLASKGRMHFKNVFDSNVWLQEVQDDANGITWCYATPTMWMRILQCCDAFDQVSNTLRLLRSGASALLHADACRLSSVFGSTVLPTASMTECMPVATPPSSYRLTKPSSVGCSYGVVVQIKDAAGHLLRHGQIGELCLSDGKQLFRGYEGSGPRSFFRTGDLGCLDAENWLFITSRIKECINRGGEVISPIDVESGVRAHPQVEECMAFSTLHADLQECVGIAIPWPSCAGLDLDCLRRFWQIQLSPSMIPLVLVVVDELPRHGPAGKLRRIGFASAIGLPIFQNNASCHMYVCVRGKARECTHTPAGLAISMPCDSEDKESEITVRIRRCVLRSTGIASRGAMLIADVASDSLSSQQLGHVLRAEFGLASLSIYPQMTLRKLAEDIESLVSGSPQRKHTPDQIDLEAIAGLRGVLLLKVWDAHVGKNGAHEFLIDLIPYELRFLKRCTSFLLRAFFHDGFGDTIFLYVLTGCAQSAYVSQQLKLLHPQHRGSMRMLRNRLPLVFVPYWTNLAVSWLASLIKPDFIGWVLLVTGQHFWAPQQYYRQLNLSFGGHGGFELWWMTATIDFIIISPFMCVRLAAFSSKLIHLFALLALCASLSSWSLEAHFYAFPRVDDAECRPLTGLAYATLGASMGIILSSRSKRVSHSFVYLPTSVIVLLGAAWKILTAMGCPRNEDSFAGLPPSCAVGSSPSWMRIVLVSTRTAQVVTLLMLLFGLHGSTSRNLVFHNRILVWLGERSLIFYLIHVPTSLIIAQYAYILSLPLTFLATVTLIGPVQFVVATLVELVNQIDLKDVGPAHRLL